MQIVSILNDSPQNFRGPCIFKVCVGGVWAVGGCLGLHFTYKRLQVVPGSRWKVFLLIFRSPLLITNWTFLYWRLLKSFHFCEGASEKLGFILKMIFYCEVNLFKRLASNVSATATLILLYVQHNINIITTTTIITTIITIITIITITIIFIIII